MKNKKTERQKLKEKLMKLVKEHAKKRDNYTCRRCGRQVSGSSCHGAHVIPVSACLRLAFDPANVICLCHGCHIQWWHLHNVESGYWFTATYPELWEYLQIQKRILSGAGTIPLDWYRERIAAFEGKVSRENVRVAQRR